MTRWEYRVEIFRGANNFNQLGTKGWELFHIGPTDDGGRGQYWFKRQITEITKETP